MDLPEYQVARPHVHSDMDEDTRMMMYFLKQTTTGKRWFTMLKRDHQFRNDLDAKSFIAATLVLDVQHRRYYEENQPLAHSYDSYTLQEWGREYENFQSRVPVLEHIVTELQKARSTSLKHRLRRALKKHPIPSSLLREPTSFPPVFPNTGDSTPTTAMSGASTPRTRRSEYSTPATRWSDLSSPRSLTVGSSPSRTATPASTLGSATSTRSSASHSASPATHTPALGPHFDQAEHARQLSRALIDLASSLDWVNNTLWDDTEAAGMLSQQYYPAGHQNPPVAVTRYGNEDYNTYDHEDHFDARPYSRSLSVPGGVLATWNIYAPYPPASSDPNQLIDQHITTIPGDPALIRHWVTTAPQLPWPYDTRYGPSQGYYP